MIGEQDLRMDRLHQVPGGDSCLYGGGRSLPEGVVEGGAAIRQVGIDLERKITKIILKQELYLLGYAEYLIFNSYVVVPVRKWARRRRWQTWTSLGRSSGRWNATEWQVLKRVRIRNSTKIRFWGLFS